MCHYYYLNHLDSSHNKEYKHRLKIKFEFRSDFKLKCVYDFREYGFDSVIINFSKVNLLLEYVGFQSSLLTGRGISDKWCFSDSKADGSFSSVQGVPTKGDSYTNVNP